MDAQRQPKAYSYKRFSTPAQEQGDSLRRQTAMDKRGRTTRTYRSIPS